MRISRFFAVRALAAAALLAVPALAAAQGMPPIAVTVAEPLAKRITQWDEFHGRFEAVESVDVRARVSGFIDQVHFKDGQTIQAGDLLFTIDQRPFLLAVESARAEVARTAAQVELQDTDLERATPLVRTGAITQREFDQRRNALHAARAQLDVAKVNLKISELNLEWSQVRAPIAGRVSNRKIDAGNLVVGGQTGATLLTTIVALDPIYFVFDVSEADYLRYSRLAEAGLRKSEREGGNPIRIRLGDEQVWSRMGTMDFIDNQMNARSGTVRGRAVVENKRHLLTPGLFGRGQLYGGDLDALLVPDAAIVSDQTRKIVFTVGPDNVVKAAMVSLGPIVDGLRVVTTGLKPEDRVVIDGLANPMVRPGAKVAPEAGKIVAVIN
jgi:multidrug efflux system membrane fusion protein